MRFIHKSHHFFASNGIFFPANEEATIKTKQPIKFQGSFKVTNHIAGKWKTKCIMRQILQHLFPNLLFFFPQEWMNFILNRLNTALIKYLNWQSPVFGRFRFPVLGRFWNHAYDFSPNCTPLSSITNTIQIQYNNLYLTWSNVLS